MREKRPDTHFRGWRDRHKQTWKERQMQRERRSEPLDLGCGPFYSRNVGFRVASVLFTGCHPTQLSQGEHLAVMSVTLVDKDMFLHPLALQILTRTPTCVQMQNQCLVPRRRN